jgi:Glyoxalase-like domain
MRLDHLSYAAEPDGLAGTTTRLSKLLGERFVDGGIHPRFGTRNAVLPLAAGTYLEVVEVLDHPASDKAPFGQAVRARSLAGGGWLGWVVAVDDIGAIAARLDRPSVTGGRHRPDGVQLRWRQVGVTSLQSDPQLPFFIQWDVEPALHPSTGATGAITLRRIEIAGSAERLADWLGATADSPFTDVGVDWTEPHGHPGLLAATFDTPGGKVRI